MPFNSKSRLGLRWHFGILLFFIACATIARAIHEDEQGKFDWSVRLLGDIEVASIPDVANPPVIYLGSAEGAVGVLNATDGSLLQRRFMQGVPRCIASYGKHILVVTDDGVASLLNGATLSVIFYKRLMLNEGETITNAACEGNERKEKMVVSAIANGKAKVFRIIPDDESSGSLVTPLPINVTTPNLNYTLLTSHNVFFNNATHCSVYNYYNKNFIETVAGQCEDVSSEMHAFRSGRIGNRRVGGKAELDPLASWNCKECHIHHIRFPGESSSSSEFYFHTYSLINGFYINFKRFRVHLDGVQDGKVLLSYADQANKLTKVLVKTSEGNIVLVDNKGNVWFERFEAAASPVALALIDDPEIPDHYRLKKHIFLLTRSGAVYTLPVDERRASPNYVGSINVNLLEALEAPSFKDVIIGSVKERGRGFVQFSARYNRKNAIVYVDILNNHFEINVHEKAVISTADLILFEDMKVLQNKGERKELHAFAVNATDGRIRGYAIADDTAVPTWSVNLPGPLAAVAFPEPQLVSYRNNLRLFPNKTTGEDVSEEIFYEVRHRYPMDNVIAVAYYVKEDEDSLPTLVVVAIDSITGSIHGTARHRKVEGNVKMIIAENSILYYFLDAEKMRYAFGVWELFRVEDGTPVTKNSGVPPPSIISSFFEKEGAVFSSRSSRPPVIRVQSLGVYGGPIAALGVTASLQNVANKHVVLVFESGRVGMIELRRLIRGRSIFFNEEPQEVAKAMELSQVLIPPTTYATHRYRIAQPKLLAIAPTGLESTTHLVVSGVDLFYVQHSFGKAFDLLDTDFSKPLLLLFVVGLAVLSLISRILVKWKVLKMAWE